MNLPIMLEEGAFMPEYKTRGSSGFDLAYRGGETLTLEPGKIVPVPTGIHAAIPEGYEIQVRPRSGLASKQGITVINTPGTIDSDYRGEIIVPVINMSSFTRFIKPGDRIAQGVVCPVIVVEFTVVVNLEDLGETERGSGGLGHTGINTN